jgi:hypothetical protein
MLDEMVLHLADCKAQEDEARARRIKAEEAITAALGVKNEGSQTHKITDWSITITGKINRTLDSATWDNIKSNVPEHFHPVRYKPEIDTKGLRWLEENEPAVYATVAQAISAKPGKPSVEIKRIEK